MVQDENSASFSVCVLLINSMQIEVPTLTALIGTQAITATGCEIGIDLSLVD